MTRWIHKWKGNNWKVSTGGDVVNRLELEELDALQQNIKVTYVSASFKFNCIE